MRLFILSYDFEGGAIHDRALTEWKLARDGYAKDDTVLLVCWSARREVIRLSDSIIIESFPAIFGRFRPIYDVLFACIAPFVALKHRFRPDRIAIAEWPLAWGAGMTKLFFGGEIVVRLIGLPRDLASTRSPLHRVYAILSEWLTRFIPDRAVVINDATRDYAIARGIAPERISVLPLDSIRTDGGLVDAAKPGEARKELGIPYGVPFVLSVGRLQPEKGFDELIDVFAAAKAPAWLVILGEGALRPELEMQAKKYPDAHILLPGQKSRADIWKYFKDASAFALLSHSEGLGLVFWEAMYVGTPVIGRPIGGIKETIGKDGLRGFFWNSEDGSAGFREKLDRCLTKDAERAGITERAGAYVRERLNL